LSCGVSVERRLIAMTEMQTRSENGERTDTLIAWLVQTLDLR